MSKTLSKFGALEGKYSHEILLSLYKTGKQRKTDLLRNISKSSCMLQRFDDLEQAGLLKIENDTFNHNTKWVSLTEKGKMASEIIIELEKIL